jgi:hypothetical protein
LDESGVIDDQYRLRGPEVLDQVVAHVVTHRVDVPVGGAQQPLHPVRGNLSGVLSDGPAVLAFQPGQQPVDVPAHPSAWLGAHEPAADPRAEPVKLIAPERHIHVAHAGHNAQSRSDHTQQVPLQY